MSARTAAGSGRVKKTMFARPNKAARRKRLQAAAGARRSLLPLIMHFRSVPEATGEGSPATSSLKRASLTDGGSTIVNDVKRTGGPATSRRRRRHDELRANYRYITTCASERILAAALDGAGDPLLA
jgi:hypothetical protein